jgi:hypothetical protein
MISLVAAECLFEDGRSKEDFLSLPWGGPPKLAGPYLTLGISGAPSLTRSFPFHTQVFHCVHFECPEQQSSQKEESDESGTGDTSLASQQLDPHALRAPGGSSLPPSPDSNFHSPSRQHQ